MKNIVKYDKVDDLFNLQGKVCLLTGTGGMGEVMAEAFAQKGAKMALADVNMNDANKVKENILRRGGTAEAYLLDVTKKASVDSVVDSVVKKFGAIDILVHTAGIAKNDSALTFDEKLIDLILDINLKGTILINQAVGNVMAKQKGGKIINIGSIGGYMNHQYDSMPYEASKAGVHQVTRSFAAELAEFGINVNSIAPTWVNTKMCGGKPAAYYDTVGKITPFGRFIEPEELVGTAIFLASDAANFITGQVLMVDGGWSITKAFYYK